MAIVKNYKLNFLPHSFMAFSHLRTGEYLILNFRTALDATLINFTFHHLRRPILMIGANQKIFIYDFI